MTKTTTVLTVSGPDGLEGQRGAEAHKSGRHPAPLNAGRSRNMQANRRKDTGPEMALRSALHRAGHRFRVDMRLDVGGVRVRPDVVFTRRKIAVFVDGCFWHCCPDHGRQPTTNEWYWSPKLQRNRERDERNAAALRADGWQVVRIWEHVPLPESVSTVEAALRTQVVAARRRPAVP